MWSYSKKLFDIDNGEVTKRIFNAISELGEDAIRKMRTARMLRPGPISAESLKLEHIEDYSNITGKSLYWFFYGDRQVDLTYSPNDKKLIRFLNTQSESTLEAFYQLITEFFPNPAMTANDKPPHYLLSERLVMLPYGKIPELVHSPYPVLEDGYKKFYLDLRPELKGFTDNKYAVAYPHRIDAMPDLATLVGVSLHWLFHFKKPLFCKTVLAEQIFDYYTVLGEEQQRLMIDVLSMTVMKQQEALTKMFLGDT